MYILLGLVLLSDSTFKYRCLVQLPVVTSNELVEVHVVGVVDGIEIPRYAVGVVAMALLYPMLSSCHRSFIAIGVLLLDIPIIKLREDCFP